MKRIFLQGIELQELVDALYPLMQLKQVEQPQPPQPQNDLMTRKEVCTLLSINYSTLWKHTKSGKLKSFGIGNRVFYSREQILGAVKSINS